MKEKQKVILALVSKVFYSVGREPNENTIRVWMEYFIGYDLSLFEDAVNDYIFDGDSFPTIAKITKIYNSLKTNLLKCRFYKKVDNVISENASDGDIEFFLKNRSISNWIDLNKDGLKDKNKLIEAIKYFEKMPYKLNGSQEEREIKKIEVMANDYVRMYHDLEKQGLKKIKEMDVIGDSLEKKFIGVSSE